jgi:hypothetical protein
MVQCCIPEDGNPQLYYHETLKTRSFLMLKLSQKYSDNPLDEKALKMM